MEVAFAEVFKGDVEPGLVGVNVLVGGDAEGFPVNDHVRPDLLGVHQQQVVAVGDVQPEIVVELGGKGGEKSHG